MPGEFELALREMLRTTASEAASEAIRQQRMIDEEKSRDGHSDRFLLRSHEAAEQLAISPATLNRLTRSGQLPCVRIGSTVRYNVETIREWVRDKESEPESEQQKLSPAKKTRAEKPASTEPIPKVLAKKRTTKKATTKPKQSRSRPEQRPTVTKPKPSNKNDGEDRINPFDLLLEELGVGRRDLPALTNGDLMRIANVDTPTLHGWQYLGRALPEDALQKLRDHFGAYRKE